MNSRLSVSTAHRPGRALALIVVATLAGVGATGCKAMRGDCHKPGAYTQAQTGKPLVVPAGLDAPDTRQALRIPDVAPELADAQRLRARTEPCLDEPPKYTPPQPPRKPQA